METRKFYQLASAYGAAPVQIRAWIDDVMVFSASVECCDEFMPPGPQTVDHDVLFSWERPLDFRGTMDMKIEIDNESLLLGPIWADHVDPEDLEAVGDYHHIDFQGVMFAEPKSNIKIDDFPLDRDYDTELTGQFSWRIAGRSKFQCTVASGIPVTPSAQRQSDTPVSDDSPG